MQKANETRKVPKWYVVTGAPSSGITTLVNELRQHVPKVFPEVARTLIDQAREKGISATQFRRDEGEFQKKVLNAKLREEENADTMVLTIFERGIPDSIPYFTMAGLNPEPIKEYAMGRYKAIFYLEALAYERDYARTETDDARMKLSVMLHDAYKDLGYEVIRVPAVSVQERVKIVLSHLNK